MAFTKAELTSISREIHRVVRPGGYVVYTVRNHEDAHYRQGRHWGEDLYERNGFVVHFFNCELIEQLAEGFSVMNVQTFTEGELPRCLYLVTMQKTV